MLKLTKVMEVMLMDKRNYLIIGMYSEDNIYGRLTTLAIMTQEVILKTSQKISRNR